MNKLSAEQEAYFKDSKIRDNDGNLIPCYHGTPDGEFTYFDSSIKFEGKEAFSWFSSDKDLSSTYSDNGEEDYFDVFNEKPNKAKIFEVYLNITNPVYVGELDRDCFVIKGEDVYATPELRKLAENCNIDPRLFGAYALKYGIKHEGSAIHSLADLQLFDIVKNPEFRKLLLQYNPNCDGIICKDNDGESSTYGILNANQAKLINNLSPTTNKDFDK